MLRLLRPVTPTVTPKIDCGAAGLTTSVTLLHLFPNTYTYIRKQGCLGIICSLSIGVDVSRKRNNRVFP